MLKRQLRMATFPSEFDGRLLDQDPVSHPRLLARGTPLNFRVVPRPSAIIFLLPPLEYPSQLQERLLPLRHEIVEPHAEGVGVEYRGESLEVRPPFAAEQDSKRRSSSRMARVGRVSDSACRLDVLAYWTVDIAKFHVTLADVHLCTFLQQTFMCIFAFICHSKISPGVRSLWVRISHPDIMIKV